MEPLDSAESTERIALSISQLPPSIEKPKKRSYTMSEAKMQQLKTAREKAAAARQAAKQATPKALQAPANPDNSAMRESEAVFNSMKKSDLSEINTYIGSMVDKHMERYRQPKVAEPKVKAALSKPAAQQPPQPFSRSETRLQTPAFRECQPQRIDPSEYMLRLIRGR